MKTDTAHQHWDQCWTTEEGRQEWAEPELFVIESVELLREYDVHSILDLGCGPGRHSFYLSEQGFMVHAMDASPRAVKFVCREADKRKLFVTASSGEMTNIDLTTGSLDMVLAWNVIYHGDVAIVLSSLSEINRVLRPGGLFLGTMLSMRNKEVQTGRKISHNTYINDNLSEKAHPHFCCDASSLIGLLQGFEPLLLEDVEQKQPGSGSYHWQFILEKK